MHVKKLTRYKGPGGKELSAGVGGKVRWSGNLESAGLSIRRCGKYGNEKKAVMALKKLEMNSERSTEKFWAKKRRNGCM